MMRIELRCLLWKRPRKHLQSLPIRTAHSDSSSAPALHQTLTGRRRFYKHVTVSPVPSDPLENLKSENKSISQIVWSDRQLYGIFLDNKKLRTPGLKLSRLLSDDISVGRNPLQVPSLELALAIASEWDMQTSKKGIQPATMPLMSLVATAIDQTAIDPNVAIETCMKYLPTDTCLFFAGEEHRILLRKQRELYNPVIRWMKRSLSIELETTQSFTSKLLHPADSTNKMRNLLQRLDPFALTCMQSATMELKSVVLALSFFLRFSVIDQATSFARVEEDFQTEIWGEVEGGHDIDRLNCSVRLSSIDYFLRQLYSEADLQQILHSGNESVTVN